MAHEIRKGDVVQIDPPNKPPDTGEWGTVKSRSRNAGGGVEMTIEYSTYTASYTFGCYDGVRRR